MRRVRNESFQYRGRHMKQKEALALATKLASDRAEQVMIYMSCDGNYTIATAALAARFSIVRTPIAIVTPPAMARPTRRAGELSA